MTAPFRPSDFTDGSAPGSDPYDNPNPEYQRAAPQSSPQAKAKGANALAAFLAAPDRKTFDKAQDAIATLTRVGSIGYQSFDDPIKLATLVRHLLAGPTHTHHDLTRPRLWCDVEEAVKAWLETSREGYRIIEAGKAYTERRERRQLRTLLDKYPDEGAYR